MSTTQTPPPDAPPPVGPPERRCPRCGSTLSQDQEWCLACGAAAGTEVVESRGWRVPIYLGGALVALAILGVLLAIAALTNRNDEVAGTPTPARPAAGTPATRVPTTSAVPTTSPVPTTSALPTLTPAPTTAPGVSPAATASPTTTVEPSPTTAATTGTFPGWEGTDGDYTIIIE